jgi:nudix-type nucleoside diphosphatase (YffH/AdpP family)
MKFTIKEEKTVFDDFFTIKEALIEHETFKGETITVRRKCFERGDSVAVLLYEKDTDSLLFTEQFRYPTVKKDTGWTVEVTAGSLEKGDTPIKRAQIELQEEIGYHVDDLDFIYSFYVSPGGTSERIFLYFSEVSSKDKIAEGGGRVSEKEDIQLIKYPVSEIEELLSENKINDAKTLIAVQWFLHYKYKSKL